ncbi:hypothetical protein FNV43_RR22403 [Rhamnella rubrinervis]|uniref:Uncharacterized protein n=1 Tax=Rhamnella rubrinervis TaxID=2594499 RepID=A0A8K0DV55_9ROSA|nr:hypothetical protein FNV43_RR22403 [Rhamnella rubrinervis]
MFSSRISHGRAKADGAVLVIQSVRDSGSGATRKVVDLNAEHDIRVLSEFQSSVRQCVANRGFGLTAHIIDHCNLILKFPEGTNSTWYNEQFKIYEPLEYKYNVCEAILLWEQYRNMTTVLTREYLDARPKGWEDYAAKRIAQLKAKNCNNRTLCEEHLNLILPAKPPFHPRQFHTCAVVGNSGDLLKTQFGKEIDSHDAVIRDNEAPVNEKYAKHVGLKRDFRLVVRGAARNMVTILNGSADEVLIIKSVTHKDFNAMIKSITNPVYLFQGIVLRRGAKGTGMKSIELALSMCDIVDIYGFTVDPGYTEWTRYFSEPRKGHNPLQGRAYYQLLECLGVIRIHSPMRSKRKQDWSDVPSQEMISRAHAAVLRLKRSQADQVGDLGQFGSCKVWGNVDPNSSGPVSGSPDMSDVRKFSNYSKWEVMPFESLRKEARDHYVQMEGVSLYKMDGNKLDDLVCVRHSSKSESLNWYWDGMDTCNAAILYLDTTLYLFVTGKDIFQEQGNSIRPKRWLTPNYTTPTPSDFHITIKMQSAMSIAPTLIPLTPSSKNFSQVSTVPSKLCGSPASRRSSIKAVAVTSDTYSVDYSSHISVFPAEACEIIGGEACWAGMFPEVKLEPQSQNSVANTASEDVDREYLQYTDAKTVFRGEACDDLGGAFCEHEYQRSLLEKSD